MKYENSLAPTVKQAQPGKSHALFVNVTENSQFWRATRLRSFINDRSNTDRDCILISRRFEKRVVCW